MTGATGGTTYHFVTEGIERALQRAKESAGGQDVSLLGGAQIINQYLAARLEQVRAVEAPGVTHVKYRVVSG